jgi:hypothetical protein
MRFHQFMGWVAAFLFAAWAFALALSVSTFFLVFFIQPSLRYTVVLGHAVVLGLPIFLIFWWKRWVNVFTCICGGVFVAVASGVLSALTLAERYGLPTVGMFLGLSGAIAGIVFWFILYATGAQAPASNATDRVQQRCGIILGAIAILITGALVGMPNAVWERLARLTQDQTCHNVLRDRTSIAPQVSLVLDLPSEEAPKLTQAMQDFATTYKLQFQDADRMRHRSFISMCNDRLTIVASVPVFELQPGSNWQPITKDLIDRIETLWPGRSRFRAPLPPDGDMPRPKALQ